MAYSWSVGCLFLLFASCVISQATAGRPPPATHNLTTEMDRTLSEDDRECRFGEDMLLIQGRIGEFPDGVPTFSVVIYNVCLNPRCTAHHVHVSCGEFASTTLISPHVFRRLAPGDCLVKDGLGISAGESVFFTYANAAPYDLSVSSVKYVCE
ncbi:hypothetical protein KP509_23G066100 [Ceratopteris richardii]|uniref:Uncharacterized protein n=1 Tax=Ceratopteris richardii TaxID=49495 RepID=A0A8T2S0P3_CERRI|nr:hypothetical protein KP509_23G066100 [Ceratopteris richardii]